MRFSSSKDFRQWPAKAVTIFGMSGAGKTTLARVLRQHEWFHYSVDYRIGTRYMGEHIVDNFKREAMKNPFLRNLLLTDSIYLSSNITFDNLDPLSSYLGKPGNPDKGGLPFAEYRRRQAQHRHAEIAALLDVPEFIEKARNIYGYRDFVCDSGGSLCEVVSLADVGDPVLKTLAEHTLLLYIRGTPDLADAGRALPRESEADVLPARLPREEVERIQGAHAITSDDDVDPDGFAIWGFEQLVHHRIPLYESIARKHGYAVDMDAIPDVKDEEGFLELVSQAIDP
jgi:hypothetical protein